MVPINEMVSPGTRISASAGLRQRLITVINAVIEDQQRAFCREHGDAQIGVLRDALAPDPGGVDDDLCSNATRFAPLMIVDLYSVHAIARAAGR